MNAKAVVLWTEKRLYIKDDNGAHVVYHYYTLLSELLDDRSPLLTLWEIKATETLS